MRKPKPLAFSVDSVPLEHGPTDSVNHPAHYTTGKVECIDAIDTVTEKLQGEHAYYTGSIIKYVWRWFHKNGIEDLKKARWYLNRLISKLDSTDKG